MELNPDHGVTKAMHDQWHKVVAVLMHKHGTSHVVITQNDLSRFPRDVAVVVQDMPDGLHLTLVNEKQAEEILKKENESAEQKE